MAERGSKFSGMFEQQPEVAPPPAAPVSTPTPERPERTAEPAAKSSRPQGKRSHPDYKQFSVLLKKRTHKQAVRALDDLDNGQDLSDLMEQLLDQWLKKQTKNAS